jgi:hypothetical protein
MSDFDKMNNHDNNIICREFRDSEDFLHKIWINEEGYRHRDNGPADVSFYPNGLIAREIFYSNGSIHRKDGPAWINHNTDRSIGFEGFYLQGIFLGGGADGFWCLWDKLSTESKKHPSILKYLTRYL